MDTTLYAARFLHYAAALQLFGLAVFEAFMVPPVLDEWLRGPSGWIARASAWTLLASAIAWLMLQAGTMGEGWADAANPDVIMTVLASTGFGHVWAVRLVLAALVLVTVMTMDHSRKRAWAALALLAAISLGSLGLVGHATMDSGMFGLVDEGSQALHLLASGFWVGSLLPLAFCLRPSAGPRHLDGIGTTLHRFSGLGHIAVAFVIGTGVINGWSIIGQTLDLASTYDILLLIKIGLVAAMVGIAVINRYVFMPRIAHDQAGVRQLRAGSLAEIVICFGVLALVSVLGVLAPA